MMPLQAAQCMPDSCSADSPRRSPPAPTTQRVKRPCSSGSSTTARRAGAAPWGKEEVSANAVMGW